MTRALQNQAPQNEQDKVISAMTGDQRKSLLNATEAAIELHPEIAALGELRVLIMVVNEGAKK